MSSPAITHPPIVVRLDSNLTPEVVFRAFSDLPGRLWFDSSSAGRMDRDEDRNDAARRLSRFSFITADPLKTWRFDAQAGNPWISLSECVDRLPQTRDPRLPPFQGGIAGLFGYESSRWLEPESLAGAGKLQTTDLPTPAICLGLYDWVIAFDHRRQATWLVSQGFSQAEIIDGEPLDSSSRVRNAKSRASQVESKLAGTAEANNPRWTQSDRWQDSTESNEVHSRNGESDTVGLFPSNPKQLADELGIVSNFMGSEYRAAVGNIIERIRSGDSFQVNLAQRLLAPQSIASDQLYLNLRKENPAPFAAFYDGGDFQVLSSSPEGFLQVRNRNVTTRPIKGTVARTGDHDRDTVLREQLAESEKDHAENVMIVDLMRNDLSRVCFDESVRVTQLCEIERFQYVQHLVSVVEGRLREGVAAMDLMQACFPGGSVTGAPKIEAMRTIAELESHPRGPYCGSLGYFSCGGDADFNILIRTMTSTRGFLQIPVGGGITSRSEPAAEENETWTKAAGMLRALYRAQHQNCRVASAAG
ncbi:MAG: anthranilate synthase component I family protein [Planctomycetota bacterium]